MSYVPPQFHVEHKYMPNSNEQTHLQEPIQGRPLDHGLQLQANATSTCMVSSTSVSVFITYLLTTIIYVLIIYMNHLVTQQPPKILCTYVQNLACTINVTKVKSNFNSVKVHPQLSHRRLQWMVCWWLLVHSQWVGMWSPNQLETYRYVFRNPKLTQEGYLGTF